MVGTLAIYHVAESASSRTTRQSLHLYLPHRRFTIKKIIACSYYIYMTRKWNISYIFIFFKINFKIDERLGK